MVTYMNGRFVEDAEATVSVRSRALNYGLGCFGGIRGYLSHDGGEVNVFRLDQHTERLDVSARMLTMSLTVEPARLGEIVVELIRRNGLREDVYVRPMVMSGSNELAPVLRKEDSSLVVYLMPLRRYMDKDAIHVCVSSWRRVADNAIPARAKPTAAYLNSALARREAFDNGYDEAILLTERGAVSEGSAEHVFVVQRGRLVSPPSTEDNLDGITRRSLIALAREDLGLEVTERPIARTELYVSDEMFLCGTGAEVTPVASVDRRPLGDGGVGPITRRVKQHFEDVVRGRVAARSSWLTPVWK
ncbi:MAG: branched-chain amino acid transaminase [Deltaproteobacteria bacterium]|nr:branched-chain amino acid transaminase [Deltaproteobacteria bacterium]